MAVDGVRFLHAGELKLGSPLFGVGGLPYQLRSILADARYRAADRLFSAAISARVDFVLLVGGVLNEPGAGARPCWFLAEQFDRLAAHDIPVYWFERAGVGHQWSDYVPVPQNLVFGESQTSDAIEFQRHGQCVARIIGDAAGTLKPTDGHVPRIVPVPDGLDGMPLASSGVDYWALGGATGDRDAPSPCGFAYCPGAIQGHSPADDSSHGAALVTIDRHRGCTTEFVETESVRWQTANVRVVGDVDWAHLRREMSLRQDQLIEQATCDLLIIRWKLTGHGPLWQQLRRDDVCRQLQSKLVKQGRDRRPAAWSLSIDLDPDAEQLASWSVEEGVFGEASRFLRRTAPVPVPHFSRTTSGRRPAVEVPVLSGDRD